MTTPEKFRRRQRIEGFALAFLGVFVTLYIIVDRDNDADRDREQRACLIEVVSQQNAVLEAGRAANNIEQAGDRNLINAALEGKIQSPEDLKQAKADYAQVEKEAKAKRAEAPVPPDPEKVC